MHTERLPKQHSRSALPGRMTSADLVLRGDGRLIVFGGPYSNLEATRALLDHAAELGVPADRIVCTGDVVAYGADPAATVELMRQAGCHVVRGNCEENLAAGAADCGCGFSAGSACERLSIGWFAHAARALDPESLAWMASLPRRINIEFGGRRLAVVHGSVRSINRFIFASTAARVKNGELDAAASDGVLAGHCGLPFTQVLGKRLWHNAGAIGLPANDGTPRGWYSVLTADAGSISIAHCALEYDHRTAAAKMCRARLPEEYAVALEAGLWPSCDVLPRKEIRERGVAIEESHVFWPIPEGRR
jgi:predicted phosphodiesterase